MNTNTQRICALSLTLIFLFLGACGKKGNPVAPEEGSNRPISNSATQ